jgi:hypothetical protein
MDHQDDNTQPLNPDEGPVVTGRPKPDWMATYPIPYNFIPDSRTVPLWNALAWIMDVWGLFRQRLWLWVGFILVYTAVLILLRFLPFYGGIIAVFIQALLIAGVISACDTLRRGGSFTFGYLFAGFKGKIGPLVVVGLVGAGFAFALVTIITVLLGDAIHQFSNQSLIFLISTLTPADTTPGLVYAGAIYIVGRTICTMMFWFTSTLLMMHDMPLYQAFGMSVFACIRNILPETVFFLLILFAWVVAFWMQFALSIMTAGITPRAMVHCLIVVVGMSSIPMLWNTLSLAMDGISPFKAFRTSFYKCYWSKRVLLEGRKVLFRDIVAPPVAIILIVLGETLLRSLLEISFLQYLLEATEMCFLFICTYTAYRDIFFDKGHGQHALYQPPPAYE